MLPHQRPRCPHLPGGHTGWTRGQGPGQRGLRHDGALWVGGRLSSKGRMRQLGPGGTGTEETPVPSSCRLWAAPKGPPLRKGAERRPLKGWGLPGVSWGPVTVGHSRASCRHGPHTRPRGWEGDVPQRPRPASDPPFPQGAPHTVAPSAQTSPPPGGSPHLLGVPTGTWSQSSPHSGRTPVCLGPPGGPWRDGWGPGALPTRSASGRRPSEGGIHASGRHLSRAWGWPSGRGRGWDGGSVSRGALGWPWPHRRRCPQGSAAVGSGREGAGAAGGLPSVCGH